MTCGCGQPATEIKKSQREFPLLLQPKTFACMVRRCDTHLARGTGSRQASHAGPQAPHLVPSLLTQSLGGFILRLAGEGCSGLT